MQQPLSALLSDALAAPAPSGPCRGIASHYTVAGVSGQTGSSLPTPDFSSTEGTGINQQRARQSFEQRVAWLEEDVALLQRRFRDEGCAKDDSGLRALDSRLELEFAAERRAREAIECRVASFEESLQKEQRDRARDLEERLNDFTHGIEVAMKAVVQSIEESLQSSTAAMKDRSDQTELRLRMLLKRVDEGLSAGAVALQDTISKTPAHIFKEGIGNAMPVSAHFGGGQSGGSQAQSSSASQVSNSGLAPTQPLQPPQPVQSYNYHEGAPMRGRSPSRQVAVRVAPLMTQQHLSSDPSAMQEQTADMVEGRSGQHGMCHPPQGNNTLLSSDRITLLAHGASPPAPNAYIVPPTQAQQGEFRWHEAARGS